MRIEFRPLLLCLFSCVCLVSVGAADLKTFREVYQKNSEGITQAYQPKFAGVQQQYQKALDRRVQDRETGASKARAGDVRHG